jgi:hypothetical protein
MIGMWNKCEISRHVRERLKAKEKHTLAHALRHQVVPRTVEPSEPPWLAALLTTSNRPAT